MHEVLRAVGQGADLGAGDGRPHRVEPRRDHQGLAVFKPEQPPVCRRLALFGPFGHRGARLLADRGDDYLGPASGVSGSVAVAVLGWLPLGEQNHHVAEGGGEAPQVGGRVTGVGVQLFLVADLRRGVPLLERQPLGLGCPSAEEVGAGTVEQRPCHRRDVVGQRFSHRPGVDHQGASPAGAEDRMLVEAGGQFQAGAHRDA